MWSIRAEFRKDDHRTVFNTPSNDYDINIVLHNLSETDMTKTNALHIFFMWIPLLFLLIVCEKPASLMRQVSKHKGDLHMQ